MAENAQSSPDKIAEAYAAQKGLYAEFASECERLLTRVIAEAGLAERVHVVASRSKTVESLKEKLGRPEKQYRRLQDVMDLAGLRVITFFATDVDQVARLIEREFEIDFENSVDRRRAQEPEKFGYSSLHYVCTLPSARTELFENARFAELRLEVQIRSLLQHGWAEINHDLGYKAKEAIPAPFQRRFARLAGMLELADEEFDAIRQGLVEYASRAREAVSGDAGGALIDKITVREFIESDALVTATDMELAELIGAENLVINQGDIDGQSEWIALMLQEAGFQTISDARERLRDRHDIVVEFFHEQTRRFDDSGKAEAAPGVSLANLVLLTLAEEGLERLDSGIRQFATKAGVLPPSDLSAGIQRLMTDFESARKRHGLRSSS